MLIVDKRTDKQTKFRVKTCPVCNIEYGTYRNDRVLCSRKCAFIHTGKLISKYVYRNCKTCNKPFRHKPSEDRRGSRHLFCSMSCRYPNKKLNLPKGQYYSYDGYIVLNKTDDGRHQIKLHRYIMEQSLGRKLLPTEIVHHINYDKLDNRLENLKVLSRTEHNLIHHPHTS